MENQYVEVSVDVVLGHHKPIGINNDTFLYLFSRLHQLFERCLQTLMDLVVTIAEEFHVIACHGDWYGSF